MLKLIAGVEATNRRHKLFASGEKILVALSGGPDSVALFHLLNFLKPKYNLALAAAHVNHGLRREAREDQKFCRLLCRIHGIDFHAKKSNIKDLAGRKKISIEQAGRDARYGYFLSLCSEFGYTRIATGHNADDNAETVLLNLIRGADLGGVSGIPPKRANIIRPLIEISREEILEFLHEHKLSYRQDLTNLDSIQSRNIIRNQIIPSMMRINKKASRNISRAGEGFRKYFDLIQDQAAKMYKRCIIDESNTQIVLDLRKLPVYYKSLGSWVLLEAYFSLSGKFNRPGSDQVTQSLSLERSGSIAFLDPEIAVTRRAGRLILNRIAAKFGRVKLKIGGNTKIGNTGLFIRSELIEKFSLNDIKNNPDESTAFLDKDKLGEMFIRNLKPGDKFKPLGMKGTKKIFDYLNERGVPGSGKSMIPLVTSGKNIAWIAGYGIADDFKVAETTGQVLKLQLISEV
jgi:tRNA(Ile)-lysidine synthase